MGTVRPLLLFSLVSSWSFAQLPTNAPFQTVPTQEEPEEADLTEGIIAPEFVMPKDFTLTWDEFEGPTLIGEGAADIKVSGNIRAKSGNGDTLRSEKASLSLSGEGGTVITFRQNVRMRGANGIEVFADQAILDEREKTITFRDKVAAYQGTVVHRGDSAVYHYGKSTFETRGLRTAFAPLHLEAGQLEAVEGADGKLIYKARNAGVTTHDAETPNYWLRGDEITLIPDERIRYDNMKLYVGGTPIFWLPTLSHDLDGQFNYRPTAGSKSIWGPYLLNSYTHRIGGLKDSATGLRRDEPYEATWNADIYTLRGLGTGLTIEELARKDNPNLGWLSLYSIYDFDPSQKSSSEPRDDFSDNHRYKVQIRQRLQADWLPGATGHLDANLTLLSDLYYLEDFEPGIYRTQYQPDNVISLTQQWDDAHLLTAWTRIRLNDFYQTDSRYPEVALDQVRRPLFDSPILHESQNLFGIYREDVSSLQAEQLREEAANASVSDDRREQIETLLDGAGFARLHTYHEFSVPLKLDSGLRITPRAGAGYTRYDSVNGSVDSFSRTHYHASLDASLKFTKRYPEWMSKQWGLDSALHVLQPYVTATLLATDDPNGAFYPIDRLTPSTRPRALTPGRFAALDSLADWQILRLGMRNTLLTRRNDSAHEWFTIDTYMDVFGEDPEFDRNVSNLYNDLHWSPLPWFDLTVETQVPLFSDSNFTEFATGLYFMVNDDSEIGLSHRFLRDHPILDDSNRLELRSYHRLNEEWGLGTEHVWEFADSTLESQEYSIHRNLDSWAFSAGVYMRDNLDEDEYGFQIGFTLTDFPSVALPFSVDN
ncbi:MAG: hypothetical protein Q7Q71_12670 [Verrucomicrobiota bacterium JB023]|nr:hypothetical protein [Verrucomicrobiota bacterium JB023]